MTDHDDPRIKTLCLSEPVHGGRSMAAFGAAAMTYVAAFVTSLLTLLYWAYRLGLLGGRRN
jgi:Zn-dependent membrane protease YugP